MKPEVRTRIAPSPTGYLHIGTARTALFNYLFARQNNGKFLLRIEDTDFARNSEASYASIINGMQFLGLTPDETPVYQSKNLEKHTAMALKLIESGSAYYCFLPEEEITKRKQTAESEGKRYIHKYTKGDEAVRDGIKPVVRIKTPRNLDIINEDLVQGRVVINTETIDDFVILRSNGTPVYMLSVVCDDIEMNITHVLRGDDHLTNTPKQILIYNGLGVKPPLFGHIPLIHGMDGKKLSKRHGALAVEEYINMGYLPEALRSYLVRLGWGSENDNVLTDETMLKEFGLKGISKAPSKFDFEKLKNINHHFIVTLPPEYIIQKIMEVHDFKNKERLERAVLKLRYRSSTILEMFEEFKVFEDDFVRTADALELINKNKDTILLALEFFKENGLDEAKFKEFFKEKGVPLSSVFPALRACLLGVIGRVGIFEIAFVLGEEEFLKRIKSAV